MSMQDDHGITVPLPGGIEVEPAGPAHDTDGDGVVDSVVLAGDDGDLTILSDVDGDAVADVAVEVDARGGVTVAEHTGDGGWTVTQQGTLGEGPVTRADDRDGWAPGTTSRVDSPVTVDPETGEWVK